MVLSSQSNLHRNVLKILFICYLVQYFLSTLYIKIWISVSVRLNVRTPTTPLFLLGFEQQGYVWIALATLEKMRLFWKSSDFFFKIIGPIFFQAAKMSFRHTCHSERQKCPSDTHLFVRTCTNAISSLSFCQICALSISMNF